jgi:hypothetical protein
MQQTVNSWRVLLKAFLLFVVLNLLFALFNPPIGKITAYNWLLPGRVRFPYAESPQYDSLGYNAPVIEDFDAMFGAHIISAGPKPADEFRVLLLGDSSTWGGHVPPEDMLAEQFNRLGLVSCDGRKIKAYDLGYPWPSLLRDVLILDKAMEYQPDMIIWLVTLHSFEKKPADRDFLGPHAERMDELIAEHQLVLPKAYSNQPGQKFLDKTIIGQRAKLKNFILNQVYGFMWSATGIDNYFGLPEAHRSISVNVEANLSYFDYRSEKDAQVLVRSFMFDILRVGHEISGDVPLIIVNEPIFIATGMNSDLRYNYLYPRWAYDAYRKSLTEWIGAQGYPFYDYWDAIPVSEFANNVFHRDSLGEQRFGNILSPVLQKFSCP